MLVGHLSDVVDLELDRYRAAHVSSRIRRALEREAVADAAGLVALLARDAEARGRFRRSVAVTVTGVFRDPDQFDLLERTLLPGLLERGRRLTVWSAGCADGSELFSLAILLDRLGALDRSHLLGSDLLAENVAAARLGTGCDGGAVVPRIRDRCTFEVRDLLRDGAPPGSWRLVLCRNVAIYLAPHARARLYETLGGTLAPGGILLLGRSERLASPAAYGLERAGPHAYRRAP
jgi:chemotaxis protein methyltransferase CheR